MKKLKLLICMLCVCMLCSCQLSLLSKTTQLGDKIEHSYSFFTGTKKYSVTLDENEAFFISNEQQNGSVSITIKNNDNEIIYESDNHVNDMQADAPPGVYTVKISAKLATGNYKITWK